VTATYGTPYAPQVIKYRSFRDNHIKKHNFGLFFIRVYNLIGPHFAKLVTHSPVLKHIMATVLGKLSKFLPEEN
jgi:hypothetical protein